MARQRIEASDSHARWRLLSATEPCFGYVAAQFAIAVDCSALYNLSPIESQVAGRVPGTAVTGNATSGGRP